MTQSAAQQFVIQAHQTPQGLHWDLMLEMGDVLRTWRLNTPPQGMKDQPIESERIADHPLRFLAYEGPVQNGTGQVTIADKGDYILLEQTDTTLMLNLFGGILNGRFALTQTSDPSRWIFQSQIKS